MEIGAQHEAPHERHASRPSDWHTRSRGVVHFGLLLFALAALGTLQLLHVRNAYHSDVGLVFVGLVVIHLAQRRRTLIRMVAQIARAQKFFERKIRLAASDVALFVITANVLVSGLLDWSRGEPTQLPLPTPLGRWHLDSAAALVIYLIVHVWHRRKHLWRSTIR